MKEEFANSSDKDNAEIEERKKFFFKTIKSKNWGKILFNIIVGFIFSAYFIQLFVYNSYFTS